MSLIAADESFLVWGVLIGLVAFGFWAEQNTRIGKYLTGIILSMAAAMLLSNLHVLPFTSPTYSTIFTNVLPIAIPLTLFRADVIEAFRKGGATVGAFFIGSVGVVLGALLAAAILPLGDATAVAAGLYTATYTGGSANLSAMAIAADFNSGPTLTSIIAADIVATNVQTIFIVALPGIMIVRRWFKFDQQQTQAVQEDTRMPFTATHVDLAGAALAISVAFLLVYLGKITAEALDRSSLGILFTTAYTLIISNFMKPLVRRMSLDFEIGIFALFLFLVALAAGADVASLVDTGVIFFVFAMVILAVHTLFLIVVGKLLKLDLRALIIGSTACVGGVTTAAAIASAKGWRHLIIPGILAGTIGNAFGTFFGVWVWTALS